jgi:rhamnosyl/mannosyltransferase
MRILHLGKFYPPHHGGIETHVQFLCRELTKSATIEVIVANDYPHDETESLDGVKIRRLRQFLNIAAAPVCHRLIREIRTTPADIVHLHVPNPYVGWAFLMSGHPAPLVISWHSDIVRQRFLAGMFQPVERVLVRRAMALIVSSPNYLESSPTLRSNRDKCCVIPYGIDVDEFLPRDPAHIDHIRRRYDSRLVLAVGRLVYYKGFEYLIRAMANVRGHLLIVGEGPLKAQLHAEAAQAGVSGQVTFLGDVDRLELLSRYQAAAVFVLPSVARSEAFGIVQLEAMASGKPVINTRLASGVPFVSIDGETGITVKPADPAALAGAINLLLDQPQLRARYGAAARRRVRDHFSVATMAANTLELYKQISADDMESRHFPAAPAQLGH